MRRVGISILLMAFSIAFCRAQLDCCMSSYDDVYSIRLVNITVKLAPGSVAEKMTNIEREWKYYFSENESPFGMGFVVNEGYFMTSRILVEPWAYLRDTILDYLLDNPLFWAAYLTNEGMGGTVDATYRIESPTGDRRELYLRDFSISSRQDEEVIFFQDADTLRIKRALLNDEYAYAKIFVQGGLQINRNLSSSLSSGTPLWMYNNMFSGHGFDPHRLCVALTVANAGRDDGHIIVKENLTIENIGSPVLYERKGTCYLVGMVSRGVKDGSNVIIPMSQIKNF